jgi:hypothetical protein
MVVEFRETSVNTLDRLERAFLEWVISARRTVTVGAEPIARIAPAAMAPQLGEMLAAAATGMAISRYLCRAVLDTTRCSWQAAFRPP